MKKILPWFGLAAAVAIVAGGGYWLGTQSVPKTPLAVQTPPGPVGQGGSGAGPGIAVEAVKVAVTPLPQSITAVGSLRSDEAIILRPEISGRISEILFREGQRAAKDSVLVRFDSSVQRAELEQAKANLSLSKSKYDRAIDLQKKGFISSQAREEAENNYRVAQASAELATARLSKLELRAPFSGIVGLRSVSIGDYVKDGQDIVNLEEIDPLKVDFRVPEKYLKQVNTGQSLQISLDAFPDRIYDGRIYAINPLVDTNGRAIVIRAHVKNSESRLRPGMFARVRLLLDEKSDALVVPEQALMPQGDDQYVFKVVDGRAQRVKVGIGQRRDGRVEIVQGLQAGELIVTAGQPKIRDGVAVAVADPAPQSASKAAVQDQAGTRPPGAARAGGKS